MRINLAKLFTSAPNVKSYGKIRKERNLQAYYKFVSQYYHQKQRTVLHIAEEIDHNERENNG